MEKKTIGRFIAALRKANGLTQRELAERLCVSDKAVSRWERDETAPDLTLIPVIAEIFGVTSDELLRGERAPAAPTAAEEERAAMKTEKQRDNMLRTRTVAFRVQSVAAGGVALAGLLAALLCNFAFYRAHLGFFLACLFYLAAGIVEVVALMLTFSSVGSAFEGEGVDECKRGFVTLACVIFTLIAVLFALTLPFFLVPWDAYSAIDAYTWLSGAGGGLLYALIALLLAVVVSVVFRALCGRLGLFGRSERQRRLNRLEMKCSGFTAAALLVTLIAHLVLCSDYALFAPKQVFDNFEDFVAFMETETDRVYYGPAAPAPATDVAVLPDKDDEEDLPPMTIENSAGEVLCEYHWYNRQVASVRYSGAEGGNCLPITVYTMDDMDQGRRIRDAVSGGFFILYLAELAAGTAVYLKKRKELN